MHWGHLRQEESTPVIILYERNTHNLSFNEFILLAAAFIVFAGQALIYAIFEKVNMYCNITIFCVNYSLCKYIIYHVTQDLIEKYRRSINAMVSDSFPGQLLFNM